MCKKLGAGTYATSNANGFLPGLAVTLPDGWVVTEQDRGEFGLMPADHPDDKVFFGVDLAATTIDGRVAPGVPGTAAGLIAWLAENPDLTVSTPSRTSIGDGIDATTVDVGVSPSSAGDPVTYSDCPASPCVGFLKDPRNWPGALAIASGEVVRLYFSTIGSGTHTLVIALDAPTADELERLATIAQRILDSVRLPSHLVVQ